MSHRASQGLGVPRNDTGMEMRYPLLEGAQWACGSSWRSARPLQVPTAAVQTPGAKACTGPAQRHAVRSGPDCHHGCSATEGQKPLPTQAPLRVWWFLPDQPSTSGLGGFCFDRGFLLQGV